MEATKTVSRLPHHLYCYFIDLLVFCLRSRLDDRFTLFISPFNSLIYLPIFNDSLLVKFISLLEQQWQRADIFLRVLSQKQAILSFRDEAEDPPSQGGTAILFSILFERVHWLLKVALFTIHRSIRRDLIPLK